MVSTSPSSNRASIFLGTGDGSFALKGTLVTGASPWSVMLSDVNGDGNTDLATGNNGSDNVTLFLGKGDGSFSAPSTLATGDAPAQAIFADLNGDGADDIVVATGWGNQINVMMANSKIVPGAAPINLSTRRGALDAMSVLDERLAQISSGLGATGAFQSRLAVAANTLSVARENYISAKSQISDVDVSEESAQLTRLQILQQSAVAVLAQANQTPALALSLLHGA